MSANDARWSVFWASTGARSNPPSASSLSVGKYVGEDSVVPREDETIGYLVIEAGNGSVGGLDFTAGVTLDNIEGILQSTP